VDSFDDEVNEISGKTIGAATEVHRRLGPGHPESVYSQALRIELRHRLIRFEREVSYSVDYRGLDVGGGRMDFVIADAVVVEIKAVRKLVSRHEAQILSYLKASGNEVGLLMNFNRETLKKGLKRRVLSQTQS